MLYWLAKNLTYIFARLFFKMTYEGLENIPPNGGYLLCGNHRTFFDPVFMCHKISTPLRFMAKKELFSNFFKNWIFRQVGAFPVARGEGDSAALDTAVDILQNGGVMLIFPEGTRSRDNKPLRPRSGVSFISAKTGAGVVPCSIDFTGKLGFRSHVTLRFHPLITAEELEVDISSPRSMRTGAKKVMDVIASGLTLSDEGEYL